MCVFVCLPFLRLTPACTELVNTHTHTHTHTLTKRDPLPGARVLSLLTVEDVGQNKRAKRERLSIAHTDGPQSPAHTQTNTHSGRSRFTWKSSGHCSSISFMTEPCQNRVDMRCVHRLVNWKKADNKSVMRQ